MRVRVQTESGDIVVEVDTARAPITSANFLKYVDAGHYDGGACHRTVKMDNQPESPIKIEVIQAGVNPDKAKEGFPAITLERTNLTGFLHKDGVVSMARSTPDSATSGWFICINDQPSLDFAGEAQSRRPGVCRLWTRGLGHGRRPKNSDGAFLDDRTTNTEAQRLTPPIKILKVARIVG